jgi:hypothetical protein
VRLATLPLANLYRYPMPEGGRRNPDWEWDEIVLACDLVWLNDWQQIGSDDPRVVELSSLLQRMPLHPQEARQHNFRNANGIARKTADIATSHLARAVDGDAGTRYIPGNETTCRPLGGSDPGGVLAACSVASTPAQATLSCKPLAVSGYTEPASVAEVTMTTAAYSDSNSVIVSVILFDASGRQVGTDTVGFTGPFAGGQVFTTDGTVAGMVARCEIANVVALGDFSYVNESPVS